MNKTVQFLMEQLTAAQCDIEAIDQQIANEPPDTEDQLLKLKQLQNMYRELAVSLKMAIGVSS